MCDGGALVGIMLTPTYRVKFPVSGRFSAELLACLSSLDARVLMYCSNGEGFKWSEGSGSFILTGLAFGFLSEDFNYPDEFLFRIINLNKGGAGVYVWQDTVRHNNMLGYCW